MAKKKGIKLVRPVDVARAASRRRSRAIGGIVTGMRDPILGTRSITVARNRRKKN